MAGCGANGKQICRDGTYSNSCTCTPPKIYGCTDYDSINYNPNANTNDGSCIKKVRGCRNKEAVNYNSLANVDDYSCEFKSTIIEKKDIPYKTEYQNNDVIENGKSSVIQEGKTGTNEITYEIIKNEQDKIISKKVIKETTLVEPISKIIEKGTKTLALENDGNPFLILYIILLIFLFFSIKKTNANLLWKKIQTKEKRWQFFLIFLYIFTIIPAIIDVTLILLEKIRKEDM